MDRSRWPLRMVLSAVLALATFVPLALRAADPAGIETEVRLESAPDASVPAVVQVRFGIPEGIHVYRSEKQFFRVKVSETQGLGSPEVSHTETVVIEDEFSETGRSEVFEGDATITIAFPPLGLETGDPWSLEGTLTYQACSDTTCFPPQNLAFAYSGRAGAAPEFEAGGITPISTDGSVSEADYEWQSLLSRFRVADTAAGYLNSERFLSFLDRAESGEADAEGDLGHILESRGLVVVVLLILLGGLALNLTPCVLPMIPVNLAIIGAGTGAQGPRGRGFALGAAYGLAMALTYGILGLLVVLTGAGFGAINSSPWFNLAIAVVFAVLALALFDVFTIDFSRFGGRADAAAGRMARGSFALALFMGTIAALLAGACVAPILISVLLLAASLYSAGNPIGLLLPFLLGLGMALPWPFAGAGISFLPKPGQWMVWVKKLFALLVAAMALYYATLGIRMLGRSGVQTAAGSGSGEGTPGDWHTAPAPALTEALTDGKPVFIDFWATYCKNCHAMDRTTFRDEDVVKRLGEYVLLKYQAEDPSDPETAAFIEQFGVIGLPTYVLLLPEP